MDTRMLTDTEVEWNAFRRDELNRLWTVLHNLGSSHSLFIHEIEVPDGPGSFRVCDYNELSSDDLIDDFEATFCLGYLHGLLNEAESSGEIEELFGVDTWRVALLNEGPDGLSLNAEPGK